MNMLKEQFYFGAAEACMVSITGRRAKEVFRFRPIFWCLLPRRLVMFLSAECGEVEEQPTKNWLTVCPRGGVPQ